MSGEKRSLWQSAQSSCGGRVTCTGAVGGRPIMQPGPLACFSSAWPWHTVPGALSMPYPVSFAASRGIMPSLWVRVRVRGRVLARHAFQTQPLLCTSQQAQVQRHHSLLSTSEAFARPASAACCKVDAADPSRRSAQNAAPCMDMRPATGSKQQCGPSPLCLGVSEVGFIQRTHFLRAQGATHLLACLRMLSHLGGLVKDVCRPHQSQRSCTSPFEMTTSLLGASLTVAHSLRTMTVMCKQNRHTHARIPRSEGH